MDLFSRKIIAWVLSDTLEAKHVVEIIEALDSASPEIEVYYSTKAEEILMIFDGMVNGDDNKELIEEGWIEDYISLPGRYEINEYSIIEDFVYEQTTGNEQNN